MTAEEAIERARTLAAAAAFGGRRALLGIAGPPGAGKSTLAADVVAAVGETAVAVGLDGFHLAQAELERLGRADRKGAPDTFDVAGYVALLRRLREPDPATTIYAPAFDRRLEEPIAAAIAVGPDVRLVVTEGNYLLLETEPWAAIRPLLDEAWYVELDAATRVRRLIDRHIAHGRTHEAAEAWVRRSDEANAALVEGSRARADAVVRPSRRRRSSP